MIVKNYLNYDLIRNGPMEKRTGYIKEKEKANAAVKILSTDVNDWSLMNLLPLKI